MNKRKLISLSISLFLFAIGIIVIIQIYPYTNLRNCDIKTNFTLNGSFMIVKNNGNSVAKFPAIYFSTYRNNIYIGDSQIDEFSIKPGEEVTKRVKMNIRISINDTMKLLNTNTTYINGTIKLPFLFFKLSIPFKMIKEDNGKAKVFVWGREIEH